MRHATSRSGWLFRQSSHLLIAPLLLLILDVLLPILRDSGFAWATPESIVVSQPPHLAQQPTDSVPDSVPESPMVQQSVQLDPLNSPHPIPWNWVLATQSEDSSGITPTVRYFRTQALISPDGQHAAYSRIQMQVMADFTHSRVNSVLFVENLRTGNLQTITASSPFADNPFSPNSEPQQAGTIAILIPVAWSASGDRVLAREFESLFGTDIASDFAVVWDRQLNRIHTIAPLGIQYTNAILLGWSQSHPDRVLFRAGNIGDENWNLWAVDPAGQTLAAIEDQPITFGQTVNNIWAGPQAHR